MEVAKLLTMTGLKPASTFGSLVTGMEVAGPTSGASGLHAYPIRAHAADWRLASRFPLAGVHLSASVKMSSVTAADFRNNGGAFGSIRHSNPTKKKTPPRKATAQAVRCPKSMMMTAASSQVSKRPLYHPLPEALRSN